MRPEAGGWSNGGEDTAGATAGNGNKTAGIGDSHANPGRFYVYEPCEKDSRHSCLFPLLLQPPCFAHKGFAGQARACVASGVAGQPPAYSPFVPVVVISTLICSLGRFIAPNSSLAALRISGEASDMTTFTIAMLWPSVSWLPISRTLSEAAW